MFTSKQIINLNQTTVSSLVAENFLEKQKLDESIIAVVGTLLLNSPI